jgi:CHAT domain-containing protein
MSAFTLFDIANSPSACMERIQKAKGRARPRICWYPTGDFTFLPLHAAGIYTSTVNVSASDYIVSSYAPTLDSLIRSRANFKPMSNSELKALLVAESSAPDLAYLWNVKDEVRAVADILESKSVCVEGQVGGPSSVKTVLEILSTGINILHLACHGRQEPERPLFSHFALRDGQLSIAELMRLKLQTPTLAFLSACETATGSSVQPNQAVHLAASLLFCGFRSVIGTMW